MRKEDYAILKKVFKHCVPDNDFGRVYSIDFDALENVPREDLIEELLRLACVLDENDILSELDHWSEQK